MKSFRKGMKVLKMLLNNSGQVTVVDICEGHDIPRSTAYRILAAACDVGMLQHDAEGAVYTAGPELLRLSSALLGKLNVREAALPVMRELSRITIHSIYLMTPTRFGAVCIEKVEGTDDGLQLNVGLGTYRHLHCSGIAKVFLPYLSERELEEFLEQKLPRFTHNTVTTRKALKREIAITQQQGYGISSEETIPGARSLGFPIRDFRGEVVAALGIGGSLEKLPDSVLPKIVAEMKKGSDTISATLGYSPPQPSRTKETRKAVR